MLTPEQIKNLKPGDLVRALDGVFPFKSTFFFDKDIRLKLDKGEGMVAYVSHRNCELVED